MILRAVDPWDDRKCAKRVSATRYSWEVGGRRNTPFGAGGRQNLNVVRPKSNDEHHTQTPAPLSTY